MALFNEYLGLAMPAWDNTSQTVIQYLQGGCSQADDSNSFDNWQTLVNYAAMHNNNNPMWTNIYSPADVVTVPNFQDEGFIDVADAILIDVNIETYGPEVDRWWMSSEFAKYGYIMEVADNGLDPIWAMPAKWVNMRRSAIYTKGTGFPALYYQMFNSVEATADVYPHPGIVPVEYLRGPSGFTPWPYYGYDMCYLLSSQ
jgi:hypothetical protein